MMTSLILLTSLMSFNGNSGVSLYILPSKKAVNFSSPKSLIESIVEGQEARKTLEKRTTYQDVGHTLVELHCENSKNEILARDFTGVTDKYDYEEPQKIYIDGVGFGFAFEGVEGKFIPADEAYETFVRLSKEETIYGIQVNMTPRECLSVASWLAELKKKDFTFALNDNLADDTKLGCASFGAHALAKAGAQIPQEWRREVLVPRELVGGNLTANFISPESMMEMNQVKRWARPDEPHFALGFYDPQRMVDWVKAKRRAKGFQETEFTSWLQKHFKIQAVELALSDLQTNPVSNPNVSLGAAR